MALEEYKKKRDFKKTAEPKGKVHKKEGHSFVVQKHDASRLHYDFRIELDGVLKSWAVPKGPSFDPADKRLAMHVEDHPLEYGGFEGTIPKGEYGGGTVMLWDRGEWEADGDLRAMYHKGSMKFRLHGEKLRGGWALVRMGGNRGENSWLLIKEKDDEAQPGYDVTAEEPLSVATQRDLDNIAAAEDAVWSSNRGPKSNAKTQKPKRKTQVTQKPKAGKKAPFPKEVSPQLATLVKEVPAGEDWIHEIKYDGYRLLAMIDGGKVRLMTRNGKDWTGKFPSVAKAFAALTADQAVIDGELVVVKPDGKTDFQALQNALKNGKNVNLQLYAFDLIYLDGHDLSRTPLLERKEALAALLSSANVPMDSPLHFSDHIVGQGGAVYRNACDQGLEGIISKKANSSYHQSRTKDWVKVKCLRRQEFVIAGFTDPGGSRKGFGALVLGVHNEDGELVYAGRVGTGFNDASLKDIHSRLKKIERKTSAFAEPPTGADAKGVHWVEPRLLAEVEFTEWTQDGILRHPSFQGLREDKPPEEIVREKPETLRASDKKQMTKARKSAEADAVQESGVKRSSKAKKGEAEVAGVRLSNPDRVLYPEQKVTKLELAEFYEAITEWASPYMLNRPLSVVRCPQGRGEKCFYQKHLKENLPEAVKGIPIAERKAEEDYLYVDSLAGIISLVQMGVLEIHPWACRIDRIEQPDYMVFDLDPAEDVSWGDVVAGTLRVKEVLEDLGLRSFVKTSGGKGLHVMVPLTRREDQDWNVTKEFSHKIALMMSRDEPGKYIANMSKAKRRGKIFVDYLRNGRGATSVAAYSTRARAGAPVSTPVFWDEVTENLRPDQFTIKNLPGRLQELKEDPWKDFSSTRQSITKAMRKKVGLD
jgi:bifunctional non-homologous end joining protein LigD